MFESLQTFSLMMNSIGYMIGFGIWFVVLLEYTIKWIYDKPLNNTIVVSFLTGLTGHKYATAALILVAPVLFGFVLQYSIVAIGLGAYIGVAFVVRSLVRLNRRLALIYEKYDLRDPVTNRKGGWTDESN